MNKIIKLFAFYCIFLYNQCHFNTVLYKYHSNIKNYLIVASQVFYKVPPWNLQNQNNVKTKIQKINLSKYLNVMNSANEYPKIFVRIVNFDFSFVIRRKWKSLMELNMFLVNLMSWCYRQIFQRIQDFKFIIVLKFKFVSIKRVCYLLIVLTFVFYVKGWIDFIFMFR